MRIIFAPQYPVDMRYSKWWFYEFQHQFKMRFDEVITLGKDYTKKLIKSNYNKQWFAPVDVAIEFEMIQISEYLKLELREDDILFHADLSYPGLFHNVLYHRRPNKCYAYCHATARNRYDYFKPSRTSKFKVESGFSLLYDKIFVGSKYHADKIKWKNTEVVGLPNPTILTKYKSKRNKHIVSVCRPSIQKIDLNIENKVTEKYGDIIRPNEPFTEWLQYSEFLSSSKILLISSKEDTFNYTILDAIKLGCIPVAPNKLCFPEILPLEYLYNSPESLYEVINKIDKGELGVPRIECSRLVDGFYDNIYNTMTK